MQCPTCAAPIEWHQRFAQMVVCESCNAASLVDEEALVLVGEQAALIASSGPLALGASGTISGDTFVVVGRVRYEYSQGFWDEWCLQLDDGLWAWLSDDDGELIYSREKPCKLDLAGFERAAPGRSIFVADRNFQVREKGVGTCLGSEGQLPFVAMAGQELRYLNLRLGSTRAATLELSGEHLRLFLGTKIVPADLCMHGGSTDSSAAATSSPPGPTGGTHVVTGDAIESAGCFACAAPLDLKAGALVLDCGHCGTKNDVGLAQLDCPGCKTRFGLAAGPHAEFACCPSCSVSIEVNNGQACPIEGSEASREQVSPPNIAPFKIGQRCRFDGVEYVLTGHVRTCVYDEDGAYDADSFMLFSKDGSQRWLELENGHFVLAERLNEAPEMFGQHSCREVVRFEGEKYRFFEGDLSTVVWVNGQLPYVAKVGDKTQYYDAVKPPHIITTESSENEVEGFKGEYLTRAQVAEAFSIDVGHLSPTIGVAPAQPYKLSAFRRQARWVMALHCLLCLFLSCSASSEGTVVSQMSMSRSDFQGENQVVTELFEVREPDSVLALDFYAPVDNSWVFLDMMLVNEQDQMIHEFSKAIEYYHGYEGGESWSEGSRDESVYLKIEEPGLYRAVISGDSESDVQTRLTVRRGVWLTRHPFRLALFCFGWIFFEFFRRFAFNQSRWKDVIGDDDD